MTWIIAKVSVQFVNNFNSLFYFFVMKEFLFFPSCILTLKDFDELTHFGAIKTQ